MNKNLGGENDRQILPQMEDELALLRERRRGSDPITDESRINLTFLYWLTPIILMGLLAYLFWRFRNRINLRPLPILIESALVRVGLRPPSFVKRWAVQAALPPLSKAYLEINKALTRLGKEPPITQTPAERASTLGNILNPARKPAEELVHEYEGEIFGKQRANLDLAIQSARDIRSLSMRAFIRKLINRFQRAPTLLRQVKHDVES